MKNILTTVFITALFACGGNAQEKQAEHLLLGPAEFNEQISNADQPQLIDVRTAGEFEAGTIEGSVNYDLLDASFENHIPKLDKEKTVYVFCAKGGRSGQAASMLKEKGFTSVVDLKGGYTDWATYQSQK